MTNHERATRLLDEAQAILQEMRGAGERGQRNLAARRAQEVVELVVKALLNEMGVEYPRTHDGAPLLVEELRRRHLDADPPFLDWLRGISSRLAELRGPAFYHEVEVGEGEARDAVDAAQRVLVAGQRLLAGLRSGSTR